MLLRSRLSLVHLTILALVAPIAGAQDLVFTPTEDAYVRDDGPTSNFGTNNLLVEKGGENEKRSFLRFQVTGITSTPTCAALILSDAGSVNTVDRDQEFDVRQISPGQWSEMTLTWNNQPGVAGRPIIGTWDRNPLEEGETIVIELDASVFTADGTYDLVLDGNTIGGSRKLDFMSREDTSPPQLVLGCTSIPPVAWVGISDNTGNAPLTTTFTDESSLLVSSWLWDFGDGSTSTLQDPVHIYTSPGVYSVSLTATGAGGVDSHEFGEIIVVYPSTGPGGNPGNVLSFQKISDTQGGVTPTLADGDEFGRGVAVIGDLNGDGVEDIAVGAHMADDGGPDRGAVWIIFLNPDGTSQAVQKISSTSGGFTGTLDDADNFGRALQRIGDLDGDGVVDLIVGSNRDDDGGLDRGAFYVLFLNTDGTVKSHTKVSDTTGGLNVGLLDKYEFGRSFANLGDMDGDGTIELAVGAPTYIWPPVPGQFYICSLKSDGTVKSTTEIGVGKGGWNGDLSNAYWLGTSLAPIGDLNGDGVMDLAVGDINDQDGGFNHGAIWVVFLKSDGTVLSEQHISDFDGNFAGAMDNQEEFGHSIASLGDIDGDGVTDLAVGAIRDDDNHDGDVTSRVDRGAVWVLFLNTDGTVKSYDKISDTRGNFQAPIDMEDRIGVSVAPFNSDRNGDGIQDIMICSRMDDDGGSARGACYVVHLNDGSIVPTLPSCTLTNGSGSNPSVYTCLDDPQIGSLWSAQVDASTLGAPPTSSLLFIYGGALPPIPTAFGELLVDVTSDYYLLDFAPFSNKIATHVNPVPNDITLDGLPAYSQVYVLGPNVLTNAIDLVVGSL